MLTKSLALFLESRVYIDSDVLAKSEEIQSIHQFCCGSAIRASWIALTTSILDKFGYGSASKKARCTHLARILDKFGYGSASKKAQCTHLARILDKFGYGSASKKARGTHLARILVSLFEKFLGANAIKFA